MRAQAMTRCATLSTALWRGHPTRRAFSRRPRCRTWAGAVVEPGRTRMVARVSGSFEVVARLGAGARGDVYRARDGRLGRDVALNFLTADLARDVEARERLRREARAASALNHPHICTL